MAEPGPRRRITLIAGAHKTASSHLQQSLMEAEARLGAHGIALVPPKTMRRDLAPLWQLLRDGTSPEILRAAAEGFLALHGGTAGHLVLMDENALGSTDARMLFRKRRLYPWAHHRLGWLMALFEGHELEIALAVRHPASFLPSCWSESLHHGPYRSFRDYIESARPARLRWSDLVARIHQQIPEAGLRLWTYEDYTALGPALFSHLLGPEAGREVRPVERVMRPGISAQAVDWLESLPAPAKRDVLEARKRFPKSGPGTAFDPWSAAERAALDAAYREDIADLGRELHIRLLRRGTNA